MTYQHPIPRLRSRPGVAAGDDFSAWQFILDIVILFGLLAVMAMAVGSAAPHLIESWRLGGPGDRHAVDVEISRENIEATWSFRR